MICSCEGGINHTGFQPWNFNLQWFETWKLQNTLRFGFIFSYLNDVVLLTRLWNFAIRKNFREPRGKTCCGQLPIRVFCLFVWTLHLWFHSCPCIQPLLNLLFAQESCSMCMLCWSFLFNSQCFALQLAIRAWWVNRSILFSMKHTWNICLGSACDFSANIQPSGELQDSPPSPKG